MTTQEQSQWLPVDPTSIAKMLQHIAIFPSSWKALQIERVTEGMSTYIYRLIHKQEIFYLRVLPEEGANFLPEAAVHNLLRERGVKVPEIIYVEAYNELLQHSIMLTGEIKGQALSQTKILKKEEREEISRAAGRDLAIINTIPVEGFGWLIRDSAEQTSLLRAKRETYREFILEDWTADLAYLSQKGLTKTEIDKLTRLISENKRYLTCTQGKLAHGDFDLNHIFQADGRYTGIIDFGEIRGGDSWYDLGYFHLQHRQHGLIRFEEALIQGYGEVNPLPPDYLARIYFTSLLLNVRALVRSWQKRPEFWYTAYLLEVLREDLALLPDK